MGLAETETTEAPSLYDAASQAWSARAALDESSARNSFQHQLWTKLRISRDDYEIDMAMFDHEALPHLRLGVVIDGMPFCMNADHALAVVDWQCSAKGCERLRRAQIKDLVTLGRALAMGAVASERFPRCDQHA